MCDDTKKCGDEAADCQGTEDTNVCECSIAMAPTDGEKHVMKVGTCFSEADHAYTINLGQSNNMCVSEMMVGLSVLSTHVENVYRSVLVNSASEIEDLSTRKIVTESVESRAMVLSAVNSLLKGLLDLGDKSVEVTLKSDDTEADAPAITKIH